MLQGFLMATAGFLSVSRSVLRPGELTMTRTGPFFAADCYSAWWCISGSQCCMHLCNEGNLRLLRRAMLCRGPALPEGPICL